MNRLTKARRVQKELSKLTRFDLIPGWTIAFHLLDTSTEFTVWKVDNLGVNILKLKLVGEGLEVISRGVFDDSEVEVISRGVFDDSEVEDIIKKVKVVINEEVE